jgi:hypothetical protein
VLLMLLALAVRLPGLWTEFWLDEIWTLDIAKQLTSALAVFTEVRDSNSHPLNTLVYFWLYNGFGDAAHWSLYRVHALLAGLASVYLCWRIASRRGLETAWIATLLFAGSYLLIHFSSEGRGYSLAILCALASFDALDGAVSTRARRVYFWLSAAFGICAHLIYLHALIGLGGRQLLRIARASDKTAAWREAAGWYGVPVLFIGGFYWVTLSRLEVGGGPGYVTSDVVIQTLSLAAGGPANGALALLVAGLYTAVVGFSLLRLARNRDDDWVFYAIALFLSPAAMLAAQPSVVFVRYFLIGVAFAPLALGSLLAELWRRALPIRAIAAGLLAATLVGNALLTSQFIQLGRGGYLKVMRRIADASDTRLVAVTSDHPFRNKKVIAFYNAHLDRSVEIVHVPPREVPAWLLRHRIGELGEFAPVVPVRPGVRYELDMISRYSALSGWHWVLYRRVLAAQTNARE